jgi:hypothetical protein
MTCTKATVITAVCSPVEHYLIFDIKLSHQAHCTTVKSADLKSKKRHSFEISTPETTYLLYADTESAKDDWIGRVGKAIVRCSRTFYQDPRATSSASDGGANGQMAAQGGAGNDDDDDDIYTNDDPDNPYFND